MHPSPWTEYVDEMGWEGGAEARKEKEKEVATTQCINYGLETPMFKNAYEGYCKPIKKRLEFENISMSQSYFSIRPKLLQLRSQYFVIEMYRMISPDNQFH